MAVVRRLPAAAHSSAAAPKQADGAHDSTPARAASPADADTAAAPTKPAHLWAFALGISLLLLGLIGAYLITTFNDIQTFQVSSEGSIFAGLVVVTAAVERFMEPFTRWMPGRTAQQKFDWAIAAMENGVGSALTAATAKADRDQARSDKAIITWGLATGVSTMLAAAGGFYLLRMVAADVQWEGVPACIDALVTGLVIGSGTKPVHDLITRAQSKPADEK